MPFYTKKGKIPKKRHTIFNDSDCKNFYEELISREGFSSIYSNLYHLNRPTKIKEVGNLEKTELIHAAKKHRSRHINTNKIKSSGDIFTSRVPLFFNDDLIISIAHIDISMEYFYKNGIADEILYIQSGSGSLISNFGELKFTKGDYVIIPRGVIWQLNPIDKNKILIIESCGPIETPNKYRNRFGQLLEHSPFCERDIKTPILQKAVKSEGDYLIKVKTFQGVQNYKYVNHPFDVVGWDGYYFPWIININNFEPIVGSLHQPPPVHQTFQGSGFVVCSFVPRPFDFHKDAIPAPYPHSNIDSDEIIFYSKGDFMSREGINQESITLHPMGLPHGPQPGKYHSSIGKKHTDELAVMIDTFKSLKVTKNAISIDDKNYPYSWIDR